eukprot:gb/GECH01003001.1/.p1 GENE.gb/GECH01003001.1/~~gb/GECH01003001.1/.p1  ORF type:complete len:406 (+),score=99.21 gb/GECH01003001.1/:1-1218(+)
MGNCFISKKRNFYDEEDASDPLSQDGIIQKRKSVLIEKLRKSPQLMNQIGKNRNLDSFLMSMIDEESLKNTYLTKRFLDTIALFKQVKESESLEKEEQNFPWINTGMISSAQHSEMEYTHSNMNNYGEEYEMNLTEGQIDELFEWEENDEMQDLEKQVKIKLAIIENEPSPFQRNIREFISPIISHTKLAPKFGIFHTALVIGPWKLEWNDSAICIPRRCVSRNAILTADIGVLRTRHDVDTVIEQLARVITFWNGNMFYREGIANRSSHYGNCQDFIDAVLRELGIAPQFPGALGEFIERLRRTGKSDVLFTFGAEFRETMRLRHPSVTFNTHQELDEFVYRVLDQEPSAFDRFPNEMSLLKSFDRAFWMRHLKFSNQDTYKPHSDRDCPFGDPVASFSLPQQQ